MKTIWKFPITVDDRFDLEMPQDARILTVQAQNGEPCLWAEVYPDNPRETRQFTVVGTGNPMPPAVTYVGTWREGSFVSHLYERAR